MYYRSKEITQETQKRDQRRNNNQQSTNRVMTSTNDATSPRRPNGVGTPTHVSEPAFEFLLHAIIDQVRHQCKKEYGERIKIKSSRRDKKKEEDGENYNVSTDNSGACDDGKIEDSKEINESSEGIMISNINSMQQNNNSGEDVVSSYENDVEQNEEEQQQVIVMNENIAAKMERMGFDVGYRLVERLAQSKSLVPPTAHAKTPTQLSLQLEAVKFICKEFWTEVFRKQIDKLQTNHRGVFVLKDGDFKWMDKMPADLEVARMMAIQILALPCGLIRGALSNLGITAIVSCDFMDDGKKMNSCSFHIKIK